MTTDYREFSLSKFKEWIHDLLDGDDVSVSEIHQALLEVINEDIEYYSSRLNRSQSLLSLVQSPKAKVCDSNDTSEYCKKSWNSFWEEHYYPEEYSRQYTEEELNAMCDKAASDEEKQICREYNEREAEYYNKEDKVNRWILPVESSYIDGVEDYLLNLPNDLLNTVNWKEGDQLEWIPQSDNSYILKKVKQ